MCRVVPSEQQSRTGEEGVWEAKEPGRSGPCRCLARPAARPRSSNSLGAQRGGGDLMFHLCFDGFHSARRRFLVSGIADGRDDDGGGGGGGPRTGSFDGLSAVRSATYVPACQW